MMEELKQLEPTVEHIGSTVMILDHKYTPFTRSWCLYEVATTSTKNIKFKVVLAGLGSDDRWSSISIKDLYNVQTEFANATHQQDKENIDSLMQKVFGTFREADAYVRNKLQEALVQKREDIMNHLNQLSQTPFEKETYVKFFQNVREDGFVAQVNNMIKEKSKDISLAVTGLTQAVQIDAAVKYDLAMFGTEKNLKERGVKDKDIKELRNTFEMVREESTQMVKQGLLRMVTGFILNLFGSNETEDDSMKRNALMDEPEENKDNKSEDDEKTEPCQDAGGLGTTAWIGIVSGGLIICAVGVLYFMNSAQRRL